MAFAYHETALINFRDLVKNQIATAISTLGLGSEGDAYDIAAPAAAAYVIGMPDADPELDEVFYFIPPSLRGEPSVTGTVMGYELETGLECALSIRATDGSNETATRKMMRFVEAVLWILAKYPRLQCGPGDRVSSVDVAYGSTGYPGSLLTFFSVQFTREFAP